MSRRPGFTLIELLMTIGIIGIIAATSIPTYAAAQRRLIINQTSAELATLLQSARTKAMTSGANIAISINSTSVTQVNSITGINTTWTPPSGITLSPTTFTFTRLTGLATDATIAVNNTAHSLSRNVTVASNGKVALP